MCKLTIFPKKTFVWWLY